jgi:hypothetical protein
MLDALSDQSLFPESSLRLILDIKEHVHESSDTRERPGSQQILARMVGRERFDDHG